jgi:hypothetical protein
MDAEGHQVLGTWTAMHHFHMGMVAMGQGGGMGQNIRRLAVVSDGNKQLADHGRTPL